VALKVAIVGLWAGTHDLAPWADPEWQKWGVAWDVDAFKLDRAFDIHHPKQYGGDWKRVSERMKDLPCVYLQVADRRIPHATVYPLQDVMSTCGDYFSSSVAYMLALAIHEGAQEIALYGVTMEADDEYGFQRPNCEYLIGLARGRGIKVHIPEQSSLCKFERPGHVGRYGWIG
jgi:hypothetical protein